MVDASSVSAFAGVATLVSGLVLLAAAVIGRLRRTSRWRRLWAVPVALVGLLVVVVPATLAVFVSLPPTFPLGDRTPADLGLAYEDVVVRTSDQVDLHGWYVPSRNGAAVVVLGGCCSARDAQLDVAGQLADRGYGALLLDMRGHGGSGGGAMLWGWWGERDVRAGVDWLARQPDVVDGRIGAIGSSVGGEQALAAAGVDHRIRAVVADGATARGARDEGDPAAGAGGLLVRSTDWTSRHLAALLSGADTPTPLRTSVASMVDQRVLLIAAGTVPAELDAADAFTAAGAPGAVTTWVADGAGHIGARERHPAEWERRVLGFFDEVLAPR
jgi:dienelactone hydrolase